MSWLAQKEKARKVWESYPEDVYLYACEDADITLKLKNILEKNWKEWRWKLFMK